VEGRAQCHHKNLCIDPEMLNTLFYGHLNCIATLVAYKQSNKAESDALGFVTFSISNP